MKKQTVTCGVKYLASVFSLACMLALGSSPALTQDVEQVEEGSVDVTRDGDRTRIRASDGAIIRYSSFDIESGETVRFKQPDRSARVLNRIRSGTPSHINGNLFANGHVYLTNPSGVIFGNNAMVDVTRLYAAAGRISNEDFRNGVHRFTDLSGAVENLGDMYGNEVHLLGQQVKNTGSIVADEGVITMSSGDDVLIGKRSGTTFARVETEGGAQEVSGVGVTNDGTVEASGGQVTVGAGDTYSVAIESTGELFAREVTVDGGDSGQVQLSGTISAANQKPGGQGGGVDLLGNELVLYDLTVDASGASGGGTIHVGGNKHGEGPLPTASHTFVDANTTLSTDATDTGDGGKVVVWSDQSTTMHGRADARGGPNGGDGGFVEVSGKQLDTSVSVARVNAPEGASGTILYDPARIEIRGSGTTPPDGDDANDTLGERFEDNRTGGPYEIDFSDGATGDDGSGTGGEPFVVYEDELENVNSGSTILLEATDQITAQSGLGFNDDSANMQGDVFLPVDVDLILRTRNAAGDSAGGIDLTDGGNLPQLEFITQGNGSIIIEGSTSGEREANIRIARLFSDDTIDVSTRNGDIVLNTNGSIESGGDLFLEAKGNHTIELNGGVGGEGRIPPQILLKTGDEGVVSIGADMLAGERIDIRSDNVNIASTLISGGGTGFIGIGPEDQEDAGDDVRIENTTSGSNELVITPGELGNLDAGFVELGDPDAGQFVVADGFTQAFDLRFGSGGPVTVGASIDATTNELIIRSLGDLKLTSGVQLSADGNNNDINLQSSADFINNAKENVFNVVNGARWLVYALAPERVEDGNLLNVADFEAYETVFPEDPVGVGSGFYYEVREEENLTTDIEDTALETELETEELTELTEGERLTQRQTETLLDEYSSEEVSESLEDPDQLAGALDVLLEEPTREVVDQSTPDQKLIEEGERVFDDAQEAVRQSMEKKRNLQAQASAYEKQGEPDRASEKEQQVRETDEELEQARQQLRNIQQKTVTADIDVGIRRAVRGETARIRNALQTVNMEQFRSRNQVRTMDIDVEADPSNVSAQSLKDTLASELRERLENRPDGSIHPAASGTLSKLEEKDPIKGVGGSHIRSVSVSGTKAIPEENEDVKEYYQELSENVTNWQEENTLRFQIMGGGREEDWGFGMINIFLNRASGVYLMRSNIDLLENASEKAGGTDFGSFSQPETLEELEGGHTSLTLSGQLQ